MESKSTTNVSMPKRIKTRVIQPLRKGTDMRARMKIFGTTFRTTATQASTDITRRDPAMPRRRARMALFMAGALVAGAASLAGVTAPAHAATPTPTSPSSICSRTFLAPYSRIWTGVEQSCGGPYSSVEAKFTLPCLPGQANTAVMYWVGLGGEGSPDDPLIQLEIRDVVDAKGGHNFQAIAEVEPGYFWHNMYLPDGRIDCHHQVWLRVAQFPVPNPGHRNPIWQQHYQLLDITNHQSSYFTAQTPGHTPPLPDEMDKWPHSLGTTAEVVVERPQILDPKNDGYYRPLTNWGTAVLASDIKVIGADHRYASFFQYDWTDLTMLSCLGEPLATTVGLPSTASMLSTHKSNGRKESCNAEPLWHLPTPLEPLTPAQIRHIFDSVHRTQIRTIA